MNQELPTVESYNRGLSQLVLSNGEVYNRVTVYKGMQWRADLSSFYGLKLNRTVHQDIARTIELKDHTLLLFDLELGEPVWALLDNNLKF